MRRHLRLPAGPALYAITAETSGNTAALLTAVAAAIRGGATLVQYRTKTGSKAERYRDATALAALCDRQRVPLIINDDVELAGQIPDAGLHLGSEDRGCAEARTLLGTDRIIGISCYDSLPLAVKAVAVGADYVAFGSVFPSSTKPHAVHAALELLQRARVELAVPIAAIGGITPGNAGAVIHAGADMIAVISGLFGQPDPASAASRYCAVLKQTYKNHQEPNP